MASIPSASGSFVRRDHLIDIATRVQAQWRTERAFEVNAPDTPGKRETKETKSTECQTECQTFLVMLSPITPHLCQDLWQKLGLTGKISQQPWPTAAPFDKILQRKVVYLRETERNARIALTRQKAKAAKAKRKL